MHSLLSRRQLLGGSVAALATGCGVFHEDPLKLAERRGLDFLLKSQNPAGGWGSGRQFLGNEIYHAVPGSLNSFAVATSAIALNALQARQEPEARAAAGRALNYLRDHGRVTRDDGRILYNVWSHLFATLALSRAYALDPAPATLAAAQQQLDSLLKCETIHGGWNYYDFNAETTQPSGHPTSFCTALGLIALAQARAIGLEVSQKLIDRCLKVLDRCRAPTGCYVYATNHELYPLGSASRPEGAIGRTMVALAGRYAIGDPKLTQQAISTALEMLLQFHPFLLAARKRLRPHEGFCQNAGYYYHMDMSHAAALAASLPGGTSNTISQRLRAAILPLQEADGSWWDFPMWDFHKPYGTAFALLTLNPQSLTPIKPAPEHSS